MPNIFQNDYNSTTLVLKNIEDMNYEYLFYDRPSKKSPFIDERIFGALSSAAVIIFSGSREFKRRIFIQQRLWKNIKIVSLYSGCGYIKYFNNYCFWFFHISFIKFYTNYLFWYIYRYCDAIGYDISANAFACFAFNFKTF